MEKVVEALMKMKKIYMISVTSLYKRWFGSRYYQNH